MHSVCVHWYKLASGLNQRLLVSRLLQATGAEIINARWSVLDPGAHITPHCGVTNSKLRLHIGVRVAAGGGGLRVGTEWRGWSEGKVTQGLQLSATWKYIYL